MDEILAYLGKITLYSGSIVTLSFFLFKIFGAKWIDNRFSKELESYKHQQNIELEKLRLQINAALNKAIQIQKFEFDVIAAAWEKLQDAYHPAAYILSALKQYADMNSFTKDGLKEFLDTTSFSNAQKQEIISSSNKQKSYNELSDFYHLIEAKKAFTDFQIYLGKNIIFLRDEIKGPFLEIEKTMKNILVTKDVADDAKDRKMSLEASSSFRQTLTPAIEKLSDLLQKILHEKM